MGRKNGKAAPPSTQPAKAETHDTLIGVILDRTGSMSSCQQATISGFNEFVKTQRAAQNGGRVLMSLVQFDTPDGKPEIDANFIGTPIDKVPDLDTSSYVPRGMTPLHDAIVTSVRKFEAWVAQEKWTGKVLCLIITDGEENASQEFTLADVRQVITKKETADGWNFVYLGANQNSYAVGARMGVQAGSTANYSGTTVGTRAAFRSASLNTTAYALSASRGRQVHDWFEAAGRPDLDDDSPPVPQAPPRGRGSGRLTPTGIGTPVATGGGSGRLSPRA